MSRKPGKQNPPAHAAGSDEELAPITAMMSSRLMVLANLLKRGAILRYKRLAGLSSVEFGLVASLGRRPPMSVVRLAEAVGMDKGQISRALAELVSRKLVAKADNPRDYQGDAGLPDQGRTCRPRRHRGGRAGAQQAAAGTSEQGTRWRCCWRRSIA